MHFSRDQIFHRETLSLSYLAVVFMGGELGRHKMCRIIEGITNFTIALILRNITLKNTSLRLKPNGQFILLYLFKQIRNATELRALYGS